VSEGEALLRLDGIVKTFGGIRALSGVGLAVPPGKIVGIIGPNGAGKTTVFNVITGAYRADAGTVSLSGRPITQEPSYRIARAGISRTFQNIRLFGNMTVWEHLLVAQPFEGAGLTRLLPMGWADPALRRRTEEMLEFFGLGSVRERVARTLPSGIQRKVEMARAVTARPKLLLLDEPVAGMNHDESDEIRRLILRLRERGVSVLLIEHDMTFVMTLCDHLYVLDFGAMIAQGRPEVVRADPRVLDAYLGQAA
jgi:branched-chain amino acid transport system ATP-binding protein